MQMTLRYVSPDSFCHVKVFELLYDAYGHEYSVSFDDDSKSKCIYFNDVVRFCYILTIELSFTYKFSINE
jgi:hypothetical protein